MTNINPNELHIDYNLNSEVVDTIFVETGERKAFRRLTINPAIDLTTAQRKTLVELGIYRGYETINRLEVDERGNTNAITKEFDHELTIVEAVSELKKSYAEQAKARKLAKERAVAWDKKHNEERKAEQKRKEEELAKEEAEHKTREEARVAWIAEQGSDQLKRGCAAGHTCTRLYFTERAAKEYPGAILDYNEHANAVSRSCPSVAALDLRDKLLKEHPTAKVEIVWLTAEPINEVGLSEEDLYDREQEFGAYEAVRVTDPLFGEDNQLYYEIESKSDEA